MARIGINATAISRTGKGISNYQKNIILALLETDSTHEYFVFLNKAQESPFFSAKSNWHFIQVPIWNYFIWEQFQLPYFARKLKLDLFHDTSDRFSILLHIPSVLFLFEIPGYRYDVSHNGKSNLYHRISKRLLVSMFPQTLKKTKYILASSANTKKDLVERFLVEPEKIQVNYPGYEQHFKPAGTEKEILEIRKRLGAPEGYVLHFATGDLRENTKIVMRSFKAVSVKFPKLKLIVGGGGIKAQDEPNIIYLPFLTGDSLVQAYQGARLYVDPSSYEGFGFQLVEAMACGVPVIASTKTCIPEIVGNAGILIDPKDESGLIQNMIQILEDDKLRERMRLRGLERVKQFDWNKTASETLNAYDEILPGQKKIDAYFQDKPRILLSHSGVQYVYKVARALHFGGLLRKFYSTIYYQPERPVYQLAERFLGKKRWFISIKERRHDPKLPSQLIHSISSLEIIHRLWRKLSGGRLEDPVLTFKNSLFDKQVAKDLPELSSNFDIFYGFSGSVLSCLKESKRLGKLTILDHHDIQHETARKLLREEIELHPDFRETIPFWPPYEPYLKRVEEEDLLADHHIVPSSFAKDTYASAGMDASKISVAHLGVDLTRFTPSAEHRDSNIFRVIFVGAIGQRKGIKYLLESFKRLALPKSELVFAGNILGSGKSFQKYRHLFRHENYIEPSLLPDFYRSGSVFVLPGLYDALGQVIIEAMACGLPVIVSENTAGHDIVRDGVDGFVIPIRNIEVLSEKLLILHQDRKLREWMGRNASERAKEFSLESYSEKLVHSLLTIWEKSNLGSMPSFV